MIPRRASPSLLLLDDSALWATGGRRAERPTLEALPQISRTSPTPPNFKELLVQAGENLPTADSFDLVLGAQWTRFELVTMPSTRLADDESAAIVEACRSRFLADRMDCPELVIVATRMQGQLLVAALDRRLRDDIQSALPRARIRSIQPLLGWLSSGPLRFGLADGWIAVREPLHLTIAHLARGHLDSLRIIRAGEPVTDIAPLIRRQAASSGLPIGDVEIVSLAGAPLPPPPGWTHRWLYRQLAN